MFGYLQILKCNGKIKLFQYKTQMHLFTELFQPIYTEKCCFTGPYIQDASGLNRAITMVWFVGAVKCE